jgi:uncharacterized protein with NAD-binding domain and iron-sulfur cluster
LAAAVELSRSHLAPIITIYEARREAGGRIRSYIDETTGDTIDNGQHLLMGCYTATMHYLHSIGASRSIKRIKPLRIDYYQPQQKKKQLNLPQYLPTPLHLLNGLLSSNLLTAGEKRSAFYLGLDILLFRHDKWSHTRTCKELFTKVKHSPDLVRKLWEPIILATMNTSVDQASAQVFINTFRTIFFHHRRYSDIIITPSGLQSALIDPAVDHLHKQNVSFNFGSKVQLDDTIFHDSIVLDTCTNVPQGAEYSAIVNVYFWIDRVLVTNFMNGFLGTTLQWCFPKRSQYSPQILACTVSAAGGLAHEPNEYIIDTLWNDICTCIPQASSARILHAKVIREHRATFLMTPEINIRRHRRNTDRLFYAGDAASNGLPMTIEGAVRNGQRAARKIIEQIHASMT